MGSGLGLSGGICERVVIGSQARLRIWCLCAYGFESLRSHKKQRDQADWLNPSVSFILRRLQVVHFLEVILLAAYHDILEFLLAGAGRNQVTADDILLETFKVIDTAADGCLAEHLGCLLE